MGSCKARRRNASLPCYQATSYLTNGGRFQIRKHRTRWRLERQEQKMTTWKHPFPESTITSTFGATRNRKSAHRGVDYAPGVKALIPAVTAGRVELIHWSNVLGWVMVQSCDCSDHTGKGRHYIGYCHLSCTKHGPFCAGPKLEGCTTPFSRLQLHDKIKIGQPVGRVGSTGSASTGPHLHITLGTKLKSVFYGKVYDIQKFINEQVRIDGIQGKKEGQEKTVKPTLGSKYGRFWRLLK